MPVNKMIVLAKYGYLILSVLMSVFGIFMVANPDFSIYLLCRLGGWILILFGIVKLIGYCSRDLYRLAFEHDLASGMMTIALGLIILARGERLMHLVILLLGLCVLADAFLKIQIAIDSRTFGIKQWYRILGAAILTGAVGFLLVYRTSLGVVITMRLLGAALITEAVLNFTTILIAVKIIQKRGI